MKKHYQESTTVRSIEDMVNKYNNDRVVTNILADAWNAVTEAIEHKAWVVSSYNPDYFIRERLDKVEKNKLICFLMCLANRLWLRYRDTNLGEAYAAYSDMLNVISWLRISSFD